MTGLKPQQLPTPVAYDQECEQPIKYHRRNHAQADGSNRFGVVAQKRLPALRGWLSTASHVFRDGGLGDLLGSIQVVKLETVMRWQPAGFRAYWRWK
jgi:hypothetical protein